MLYELNASVFVDDEDGMDTYEREEEVEGEEVCAVPIKEIPATNDDTLSDGRATPEGKDKGKETVTEAIDASLFTADDEALADEALADEEEEEQEQAASGGAAEAKLK